MQSGAVARTDYGTCNEFKDTQQRAADAGVKGKMISKRVWRYAE